MAQKKRWLEKATLADAVLHGLKEEEFQNIQSLMERELNLVELGIFSALYSEHCSYKSSRVHLKTLPTEGPRVFQGPGENAGIIDIGDGLGVVFKIESHNHPSFIEPFQGAATGVGGILRDIFTMGARPVALLNSLRFGTLDFPRTSYLVQRCVAGIGSYGNSMGVPTIGGETFFHSAYNQNCLVNAFALGLVELKKVFTGKASGIGNGVFYVGSKTGRDGIHGATMASGEFDESSSEKRPTVQVGDPFQEKLLLEACLEVMETGAVVGIQDMGAAGLTSSGFEMADRAGTGLILYLDRVPQRESDMNPYEIMLSESQERMLLVVEKGREEEVLQVFRKWDLDAVQIGEVAHGSAVSLYWNGELVGEIPIPFVTHAVPQYTWPTEEPADHASKISFNMNIVQEPENLDALWLTMLGSLNLCSRASLFSQYDSTVRTNTVVHPGGDAAVIRIKEESLPKKSKKGKKEKGIAISLDCNSRYCLIDPLEGTALSVAEAIRNITAVGAEPVGISNCLNFGNPERPASMWQFAQAVQGLGMAARAFSVPVVSGNVSLYNETKGTPILPTPEIAMVGLMEDASKAVSISFQQDGDVIFLVGITEPDEIGGSEYLSLIHNIEKGKLPRLDYEIEMRTNQGIRSLIQQSLVTSCHDISSGGLAIALAECCFGTEGQRGAVLSVDSYEGRKDALLFSESGARYLLSCSPEKAGQIEKFLEKQGLSITGRGAVGGSTIEIVGCTSISVQEAYETWKSGFNQIFE